MIRKSRKSCSKGDLFIGTPLQDVRPIAPPRTKDSVISASPCHEAASTIKKLTAIIFVRSRAYHARPALNARGQVTFGLRHIRRFLLDQRVTSLIRPYQMLLTDTAMPRMQVIQRTWRSISFPVNLAYTMSLPPKWIQKKRPSHSKTTL